MDVHFRVAHPDDASALIHLYYLVYGADYPDPRVRDLAALRELLGDPDHVWIVATLEGRVVGCTGYRKDRETKMAKVFGVVVSPEVQGARIAQRLLEFGRDKVPAVREGVELVYVTTRTNSAAPQRLFERLGFKKVGVFPNVHQTKTAETHAIAVYYPPRLHATRFTAFKQHPRVAPLYQLVARECGLPEMERSTEEECAIAPAAPFTGELRLEDIDAPRHVAFRYSELRKNGGPKLRGSCPFYPPNRLFTTANGDLEVYVYFSKEDKHCVLLAFTDRAGRGFHEMLRASTDFARRALGARYVEFLLGAQDTKEISAAVATHFVPSAYIPSYWPVNELRYDHVAFSRSFEILDFSEVQLVGANACFVKQYYDRWCDTALQGALLRSHP